jgi:hypothetical protein
MGMMLINFLSNGFFGTFLRVKASRGKKVLVEVHAVTDVYYTAGSFNGKTLSYKTRGPKKKEKTLEVTQKQVFRKIGVFCVLTNEVNDNVIDIEFNAETGGDTETYDHLLKRVMMAPNIDDMKQKVMMMLLVLIMITNVITLFIVFNQGQQLVKLLGQARNI